jgi:hypothetical protein
MGSHVHLGVQSDNPATRSISNHTSSNKKGFGMKTKYLLISVLLLSASVGAFADPVLPCPSGAYSGYLSAGFTCTVGDKTFSDFGYTASGSLGLTANEIGVTPVSSGGEFGFNFFAAWNTFNGFTSDSLITYTVTAGPGFLISDAALAIAGFGASGIAQVSVADTFSNGQNLFVFFNPICSGLNNCVITDSRTFPGVLSLDVVKDIGLASGTGGSGHLSFVSNTVSQTPEPASLALLGSSLLALGYFIRKKKKLLAM